MRHHDFQRYAIEFVILVILVGYVSMQRRVIWVSITSSQRLTATL